MLSPNMAVIWAVMAQLLFYSSIAVACSLHQARSEDALMEAALEAGADDVIPQEDGSIEVLTPPYEFAQIKDALIAKGFSPDAWPR